MIWLFVYCFVIHNRQIAEVILISDVKNLFFGWYLLPLENLSAYVLNLK